MRADERACDPSYPLLLTTGRKLTQYNVGAQTRRTANVAWASADVLEIHPHDAETRGIEDGDLVGVTSRAGEIVLRAEVTTRVRPGVVYTTFHFPETGANVVTTENSDWAKNCPEYKVTVVEIVKVNQPSEWQKRYREFNSHQLDLLKGRQPTPPDAHRAAGRDGQRYWCVLRCRTGQGGNREGCGQPSEAVLGSADAAPDSCPLSRGRCRPHPLARSGLALLASSENPVRT